MTTQLTLDFSEFELATTFTEPCDWCGRAVEIAGDTPFDAVIFCDEGCRHEAFNTPIYDDVLDFIDYSEGGE